MKRVLIFRDVIVYENSKPQNMCWGKIERDRSGSQRHPEPPRRMPGNTALWSPLLAILAAPRWKEVSICVIALRPRPNVLGPRRGSNPISALLTTLAHHTVYLHLAKQ